MIDPVAALRALLLADATLHALLALDATEALPVAKKVVGVPPGLGDNPPVVPPRSVLLQPSPGPDGGSHQFTIAQPFGVRCHGPSGVAAWDVFRAVWDVFYDANGLARGPRIVANRWYLRSATLTPGIGDLEPEGWPVVVATLLTRWDAHQGATV